MDNFSLNFALFILTMEMSVKRVVVTGLGCLTPLGRDLKGSWNSLLKGKSGLGKITELCDYDLKYSKFSKLIPPSITVGKVNFNIDEYPELFTSQDARRMSQFSQLSIIVAYEALKSSKLLKNGTLNVCDSIDLTRFGCVIGSGMSSISDTFDQSQSMLSLKQKISPLFIPRFLTNMAAGNVSIKFNLQGISHCCATACATGNNSIGDAYNFVRLGYNDIIICGASEMSVHPLTLAGFLKAKSITTGGISCPFDKQRSGFVLGEGCGLMILESLDHALARKAPIFAEISGYGISSDAYHITSPKENGEGAQRAMLSAIGNVSLNNIDYVNAHATSTILGDRAEVGAIDNIFQGVKPFVSSNKGHMGHLLASAGAVESIFTVMSIYHQIIPHTLNLNIAGEKNTEICEPFQNLKFVKNSPINTKINYALKNSFGFGGVNSSLLFKKFE